VAWNGLFWLRIGTSGGLLWTRWWAFGFHKILGSSLVAELLVASQEGISWLELVMIWCNLGCFSLIIQSNLFKNCTCNLGSLQDGAFLEAKLWNYLQHDSYLKLRVVLNYGIGRLQWPNGQRHELSSLARTLGSWVRIPLKIWISVCFYSVFVLFCV
jgi:hypothetical protein